MAKSPIDLKKITPEDIEAVDQIEQIIDNLLRPYDGGEITVVFPDSAVIRNLLSVRKVVRTTELYRRYQSAGWKQVIFNNSSCEKITLNEYPSCDD